MLRAASNAAMGIMAPAKKSRGRLNSRFSVNNKFNFNKASRFC